MNPAACRISKEELANSLTHGIGFQFTMAGERKPEYFKGAQLKVGIIGCGYVGLPLALRFAEAGRRVLGFDTDPAKVSKLNQGQSYIEHIPAKKIQQHVRSKHSAASSDFTRL